MTLYDQYLLDVHDELIVDLFAGGGGASVGIEMATGRQVDIAINHDPDAVAMHEENHPQTRHFESDVFEVDPREVADGRDIGLLWASPDCTDFSKAKGGRPIRTVKRRSLAWAVVRWADQVRPRVIILENVEEFAGWGPLIEVDGGYRRDPEREGETFREWVAELEGCGYDVEWRELRGCDYGAPTTRKRLFVVARRDGEAIVWPEPTHGPGTDRPYRTAADCIDWTEPMCSIFATREEARAWGRAHKGKGTPVRPLAENTMARIARGVVQYVLEADDPYIVDNAAVALIQSGYGERKGQAPRTLDLEEPLGTVVGGGSKHALVAAYLARHWGGMTGKDLREPHPTITTTASQDQLVAVELDGSPGGRADRIYPFLQTYYGNGTGQRLDEPIRTLTTKDRMSLVVVEVDGEPMVMTDIAMRMLQPRELYRAQGFPDGYVFEHAGGKRLTKTAQVRMVGNSVCPPIAAALVRSNVPALIARDEVAVA